MKNEESLLDEFKIAIKYKSEFFRILLISFSLYILFVTLNFIFNFENFSWTIKTIDWQFVTVVLTLPVVGLMLFIKKNKFGWAICLFYYTLVPASILTAFSQQLFKKEFNYFTLTGSWRGAVMFLLSILSLSLLASKSIKGDFDITTRNFWTTLIISFILTITIIVFLLTE